MQTMTGTGVRWFKYGDECLPITNLGAEAMGTDRIRISWEGRWNHNQYVAQIRKTGEEEWTSYGTNIETQVVYDLEANTEYQIRVLPSCGALEGSAENTLTLSTLEQEINELDCGAESNLPLIENRELIAQLNAGDRITAAGFTVILREVIKNGDTYTGMGMIEVPLFNSARVEATLNSIMVNTDKQLIAGNVESTLNPNGPFILDMDPEEELSEEGESGEGNNDEEEIDDLPDTDIDIEGEIADVEYNETDSTITVTDTESNTTEIDPETADENEDGDIVIEDEEGNVWVVDDGGNVSGPHNSGGGNDGEEYAQDSLNVQEELIKEVLVYYKEEINLWIDNYEKGPLDESTINRMSDFPDCLPEDVDKLDAILVKINEYIEDPKSLLDLIQEDDLHRTKIEEFANKLTGAEPPYADGLSDEEWDELVEMICAYLVEDEEEQELTEYYLPLTITVEDDYFLSDPEKTKFSDGDTISVYDYMAGLTLYVEDSTSQEITLHDDYFLDIEGAPWEPGYTIDIEDLPQDSVREFNLSIPNISDLQMYVMKVPMLNDVPTFDIVEDSIEDVAETCTDWSEDNDISYTCNFCVRDAFYKITGLTILYPGSSNNACICCDPEEYNIDGGLVEGDGTANTIYSTLTDKDSDLAQYFEEIHDIEGEDYPNFTQMQLDADNGQLIVGVKSAGRGHVVLLMPEDLWEEDSDNDISTLIEYSNNIKRSRPLALECGQATNKRVQPLRWSLNSLESVKWYRYKGL